MEYRYFVGIALPSILSATIHQLQQTTYDPKSVLKPLLPHITLLHPNALAALPPSTYIPKIREIAQGYLPFTIHLNTIGSFDERALYIGIDSPRLESLQKDLAAALPEEVFCAHYKDRKFTPHVTLAQTSCNEPLPPLFRYHFTANLSSLLPCSLKVEQITEFIWQKKREYKAVVI